MAIAPDQQRKRLGRGEVLQQAPPAPVTALSNCLESIKRDWKQQGSMAGLWQEWPRLAGPLLAPHCRPLNVRQGVLIIGASHPQWRQALLYNRPQLLAAAELMCMEWPPVMPAVVLPQLEKWPSGDDVVSVEDCNLLTRPNRRPTLKSCSRTMRDVWLNSGPKAKEKSTPRTHFFKQFRQPKHQKRSGRGCRQSVWKPSALS